MTIQAVLFDKTILEFPDGTDPKVIQKVVKEQTAKRKQAQIVGSADDPIYPSKGTTPTPAKPDTFGETAGKMMEAPIESMKAFGSGILDTAQSPSYQYLSQDPFMKNAHPAVNATLSKIGDVGGALLSGIGAGVSGAIGLGTELVPGQDAGDELKLGNDLLGMASVAVPELAGVSSVALTAGRGGAVVATPKAAAPALTSEQIGRLANKAAKGGMGSVKAQEELAAAARLNPEAKAAADRLGIDLPADVLSDNPQVMEAAGLPRGVAGSDASGAWMETVNAARKRADEVMAEMDGAPDLATVSEEVKASVTGARDGLRAEAKALYAEVDAKIPPGTPVEIGSTVKLIGEMTQEVGGASGLSSKATEVFKSITDPNSTVTYRRLSNMKSDIARALARGDGPYGDFSTYDLQRLQNALAQDQLVAAEKLGDVELRNKLRTANQLTAKQKALEKRIVNAYGGDMDGSIGIKLRSALTRGAKGDSAALTRILKLVPDDLKPRAMAAAISSLSRRAVGSDPGGFGLNEFSKLWAGLQANPSIMNAVGSALGPQAVSVLKDLATVSNRVNKADTFVLRTGKANQALAGPLSVDGLLSRIASSSMGERTGRAFGGMAGGMFGGVGGAIVGSEAVASMLHMTKGNVLSKVGKMFASDEFLKAATEASQRGAVSPETIRSLSKAPAFVSWAKSIGRSPIDLAEEIVKAPVAAPAASAGAAGAANATSAPIVADPKPWMKLRGKY
jgi:hypothetical protein